jgi:prepilin-type processing-associated H-X9-DG protein
VCGGRYEGDLFSLKISQVSAYDDFPNGHITYSFRIFCHQPAKMTLLAGQPIMADRNPIFEKVSEDMFMVKLDNESSRRNSRNHNRRGQNVLFADGHSLFLKTRHAGIPQDDIFTVQNVIEYRGNERPTCDKDLFLAP